MFYATYKVHYVDDHVRVSQEKTEIRKCRLLMHTGMSSILCHCCVCAVCDESVQFESSCSELKSVKTIMGCIVIVQGPEVEEYPVIKRAAKEKFISWN